ncbi:MAG TPA: class I tRNA ligase family protein [Solirubrobacterales bacterium]
MDVGVSGDISERGEAFVYVDVVVPQEGNGLDWVRRFVLGDVYSRLLRAGGDEVLFVPVIATGGAEIEAEAAAAGGSPQEIADRFVERVRGRCDSLEISCDWGQAVVTSRPEHGDRLQSTFLELFEKGLVYRRDGAGEEGDQRWHLRCGAFAEWCGRGLEQASESDRRAVELQSAVLGQVEGVEVEVALLGGQRVPVFTPHPDSIGDAAFVAISPHHPAVEALASPAELEALGDRSGPVAMAQTQMQAAVPGVDSLLPVVLTPWVDERFGPTICFGIPDRDQTDREIAARLSQAAGLPLKLSAGNAKPRPGARSRLPDLLASRSGEWGTPVPIVHCESCGAVGSPVGPDATEACECPGCGGPAERDRQVISAELERMWAWRALPELERWLPARQAIWGEEDAAQFLAERMAARIAAELGPQPADPEEPFPRAFACAAVDVGGEDERVRSEEELDRLIAELGPDAVRLGILDSASAANSAGWTAASFRHAQRFLDELREFAEPRLGASELAEPSAIDRSSRLRRRLAAWCEAAAASVARNLEQLAMHRGTYELMLFLKRIRDFEQRCAAAGEVSQLDREAVAIALRQLLRAAAPCVPSLAAELGPLAAGDPRPAEAALTD